MRVGKGKGYNHVHAVNAVPSQNGAIITYGTLKTVKMCLLTYLYHNPNLNASIQAVISS